MLVRPAEPSRDNLGLCRLARRCPQGTHFRFYHHRDDFWERCRLQKESQVLVIDGDAGPAATVTFARKRVRLGGAERLAVYVFDLMVDPEHRGRGLGRGLLKAVRERNTDAPLFYAYIVEDNVSSRRLFEGEGYRPFRHRVLYHPVMPALEGRLPPRSFRRTHFAEDNRHDFVDESGGHDALFTTGRAWAALRLHERQVFVSMPWSAAWIARVLPIVPAPGRPVVVWSLHHMGHGAQGSPGTHASPAALRRLIRSVARLASRGGADALVLPLFENDPLTAVVRPLTLTRWGIPPGAAILHAAGDLAPLLLSAEQPLLLSGRDA